MIVLLSVLLNNIECLWNLSLSNSTNTFCKLNKYILQIEQIHFANWANTFSKLNKYILQIEQIHFANWANTFCKLNKYIFQIGSRFYKNNLWNISHFKVCVNNCGISLNYCHSLKVNFPGLQFDKISEVWRFFGTSFTTS